MGFFDFLGKVGKSINDSMQSAMEDKIIDLWQRIRNFDEDRIVSYLNSKERITNIDCIAILVAYSRHQSYGVDSVLNRLTHKRGDVIQQTIKLCSHDMIQLSNKSLMREIRQTADRFIADYRQKTY